MIYDVFISYRWVEPDQSWVRESLVPSLKHAGLAVCLDVEDFVPGRDLISEMTRAGTESRKAISVVSPEYFDGNRMVSFEALMARRTDPAGSESRLIPVIFRTTHIPEWMRGLIPIDWTCHENHSREWKKLLRVLGAPMLDGPIPSATSLNTASSTRQPGSHEVSALPHSLTARLITEMEPSKCGDVILVSGNVGSGGITIAKSAFSSIQCYKVPIDFTEIVREPLSGDFSSEIALLRYLAKALGPFRTPAFGRVWGNIERCFGTASRIRTMVDHSGYGNIRQSLQSLSRGETQMRRTMDPMAILKRVLGSDDDIDLVLRPQRRLLDALSQDLTAIGEAEIMFHFYEIGTVSESALVSLISSLINLQLPFVRLHIVVSVEARPTAYPILRKFRTFHIPTASISQIDNYLQEGSLRIDNRQHHLDALIAQLSFGSQKVADFLRDRPRLTSVLATITTKQAVRPLTTTLEMWSLLAVAYNVTPTLLSHLVGLTNDEASLVAQEIPDESDGGRRLPVGVAGPIISGSAPTTVHKVNYLIEDQLRSHTHDDHGDWLPPNHSKVGLAFHAAWNSGNIGIVDICLLQYFRNSLPFCFTLHAALRRLLLIAPVSSEMAENIAERLYVIEQIEDGSAHSDRVIQFFERISNNDVDFTRAQRAIAYYQLGHSYFASGQDELAAVSLEFAIDLDSLYYNAWSLLGVVYDVTDHLSRGVSALREAIRLNGKYEFAHFNLGAIYERRGKLIDAAYSYVAAIKCAPSFYEAAYNLSNTLLELNLIRDAVTVATFTGAIAQELRVEPIFNIANSMACLGDFSGAIKLFRLCLDERPDSRIAYNTGLAYAANDQPESAIRYLREAGTLATKESNQEIKKLATQVRIGLNENKTFDWPSRAPKVPVSREQAKALRAVLDELFIALKRHGLGKGAEGIRRTVAKVSAPTGAEIRKRKIRESKKIITRQEMKYARLPSMGGG